jgi:hypothetical protein
MSGVAMEAMKQSDGSPGSRKLRIPEGRDDDAGYNAQQPATIRGPGHLHIIMTASPLGDAIAHNRRLDQAKRNGSISKEARQRNSKWNITDEHLGALRRAGPRGTPMDHVSDDELRAQVHDMLDQNEAAGQRVPDAFRKSAMGDDQPDFAQELRDAAKSPADDTVSAMPRRLQLRDEMQSRRTAARGQAPSRATLPYGARLPLSDIFEAHSQARAGAGGGAYPGDQVSRASGI